MGQGAYVRQSPSARDFFLEPGLENRETEVKLGVARNPRDFLQDCDKLGFSTHHQAYEIIQKAGPVHESVHSVFAVRDYTTGKIAPSYGFFVIMKDTSGKSVLKFKWDSHVQSTSAGKELVAVTRKERIIKDLAEAVEIVVQHSRSSCGLVKIGSFKKLKKNIVVNGNLSDRGFVITASRCVPQDNNLIENVLEQVEVEYIGRQKERLKLKYEPLEELGDLACSIIAGFKDLGYELAPTTLTKPDWLRNLVQQQ